MATPELEHPDRQDIPVLPARWTIGIRDPRKKADILEQLELEDKAISTSGSYERFFEASGKRYSHIMNPGTGRPIENELLSVTIIAKDGFTADALATAVFVLGKEEGVALVNRLKEVQAKIVSK